MKLILGISGASGVVYGIRILEALHHLGVYIHLVISTAGKKTIQLETSYPIETVEALASEVHNIENIGASIASGSFKTDGMVIAPCSVKSLSAIANSYNDNLLVRAADVCLKERRKLILLVRETPLHAGHLELMLKVARLGAIIMPPLPAFYNHPQTIEDIINHTTGKVLDQFDLAYAMFRRWQGENTLAGTEK
ncbi:MAG: UbiX family flavin prenyltransferase [Bacillota bacterium]